jgi:hypothetical protein
MRERHCPLYNHERERMVDHIERMYIKYETPIWERSIDNDTLLYPCHQSKQTRREISMAVMDFLQRTEMKI